MWLNESLINTKQGANRELWRTAVSDKAFPLLPQVIIKTLGEGYFKLCDDHPRRAAP
jgi:hypothetical protein